MLVDLLLVKPGPPVREPAGHLPLLLQIEKKKKRKRKTVTDAVRAGRSTGIPGGGYSRGE
jgi:hypothetical protein